MGGELLALQIKNQFVVSSYSKTNNDINASIKNVTPIKHKNIISIAR